VGAKKDDGDLPQPGLDELKEDADDRTEGPTEGPGNVSVDEPTEPALGGTDDDSWTDAPDKRRPDADDEEEEED
jgi:hypothetical protein